METFFKIWFHKLPGIIFMLVSLFPGFFLYQAIQTYDYDKNFYNNAKQANGTVVSIDKRTKYSNKRNRNYYDRKIQYTTETKSTHQITSESRLNSLIIGDKVAVYYDPQAPGKGRIDVLDDTSSPRNNIIFLSIFTLIFFLVGILIFTGVLQSGRNSLYRGVWRG